MNKLLLLDVFYDGLTNKCGMKFYDLNNKHIVIKFDKTHYLPYCLAKWLTEEESEELDKFHGYKGYTTVKKINLFDDREEEFVKIFAKTPTDIGGKFGLRNIVEYTWEDNIRFHHNYIYDNKLRVGCTYTVKNNKLVRIQQSYPDTEIYKILINSNNKIKEFGKKVIPYLFDEIPIPNFIALDIEVETTNGRMPDIAEAPNRIVSCAFKSNDGSEFVLMLKRDDNIIEHPKIEYFDNEEELIEEIFKTINTYDIVLTFNGDNFDLTYIFNRAKNLLVPKADTIKIKEGWGYASKYEARLKRGIHIDLYNYFSNKSIKGYVYGNKYDRNSLDSISKAILGEKKIEHEENIEEMSYDKLAEYNLKDVDLTLKLIQHNNYQAWKLMILFCRISSLPLSDLLRHEISAWIKSFFYKEHRENNYLIPRKEDIRVRKPSARFTESLTGKNYRGAFVIKPITGIHFDTIVMDYSSLYPSIIKEYNLSYETINCNHPECREKIIGIPYHTCKKRMGILAYTLGFFRDVRINYFKQKAKKDEYYRPIEQALKVFINACYGVFASENFPFYCLPVAESTTAIGWESIQKTIEKCRSMGITVLYGDTDSVFLNKPTMEQIKELSDWAKKELNLELEYEKTYQLLALSHRKKNYVGVQKGSKKIDMKGILGKKRNTPNFIKRKINDLNEILKVITNEYEFKIERKKIVSLVQRTLNEIGKTSTSLDDYAIHITLSKNPKEYTKTTPQHIKVIKDEMEKFKKGDVISYIKTKKGAKLLEKARINDIDIKKYKQLFRSAFEQILDALGIDWIEIEGYKRLDQFW